MAPLSHLYRVASAVEPVFVRRYGGPKVLERCLAVLVAREEEAPRDDA